MEIQRIESKIHEIKGQQVMLDFDLAELYEVQTKNLNLAVKRNIKRFPKDFMVRLTQEAWDTLRLQIETSSRVGISLSRSNFSTIEKCLRSQIASSSGDTKMLIPIGKNVNVQGMRSQFVTASEQRSLRTQSATL